MAITGTINGGYAGYAGRYAVRIYYEYTQDINNNTSTVSAWFQIRSVSSAEYGAWSNLGSSSLSFGGYSASGGVTFDFRDYNWHTVRSLENKVITHNNDGTKTISFSASFATNDPDISSITTAWASGDVTLNTIPRASKFGTVSNFVIENSFSFPITKYNTGVDDTLKIQYSTWSKTITPYVSGQSITLSTAEKNALYALLPNATSATFNLTITTGSIGSNTATCKGTITEQKPSFSPTITISPMTAISGITTVTVTLSAGATAYKSGTISEYVVSLGSQTLRSNSYSTSFVFANCNGATVTAQAVDSRGWISNPTTKNLTQLYPYSAPVINGSVTRAPNMAGTSATLTINGTFSVVPNQTNPTVSYRHRQSGGVWSASTSVTPTYGTGTYTFSATLVETYNVAYVYEFEITVTDAYSAVVKTLTLYSAQPIVDIDAENQKLAIGGFTSSSSPNGSTSIKSTRIRLLGDVASNQSNNSVQVDGLLYATGNIDGNNLIGRTAVYEGGSANANKLANRYAPKSGNVLWTNPSPTSAISNGQTYTLSGTASMYIVSYKYSTGTSANDAKNATIVFPDLVTNMIIMSVNSQWILERTIKISGTTVTLGGGYQHENNGTPSSQNNYIIPLTIYGIKF